MVDVFKHALSLHIDEITPTNENDWLTFGIHSAIALVG